MDNKMIFDWKSTVSVGGAHITEKDFPVLSQERAFEAKKLFEDFCESFEQTLQLCRDKRFEVTGVVRRTGLDIHNKPSVEMSDKMNGKCYVLFVFESEEAYKDVKIGECITCRGNYLGVTNEFGIVMKRSEIV